MDKEYMQLAAEAVANVIPDKHGFILFVTPFSENLSVGDPRLYYVSNITRETAITTLKEWLIKCGAAEDWMKHIK